MTLTKQCSSTKSWFFHKSSLDTSESVLDCKDKDRDYSVFLAFKDVSVGTVKWEILTFKVVDNKNGGKVTWGAGSKKEDEWTDWGIAVFKDGGNGAEKTQIRVPKSGKVYKHGPYGASLLISCHKSNLKLKPQVQQGRRPTVSWSRDTYFDIHQKDNTVTIAGIYDWNNGFKPKRIFCNC